MTIKIPRRRLELGQEPETNEVVIEILDDRYTYPNEVEPFKPSVSINPEDFALIQEGDEATSAISMILRFTGLPYIETHEGVLNEGLEVPTPSKFMHHYRNVYEANQGRGVIYDTSGKLIEGERLERYFHALTDKNIEIWLNAMFVEGSGFRGTNLETITGLENGGLVTRRDQLEEYIRKPMVLGDLESLNSQGLPTEESSDESFRLGRTVLFYYPLSWNPPDQEDLRGMATSIRYPISGKIALYCITCPVEPIPHRGVFPYLISAIQN